MNHADLHVISQLVVRNTDLDLHILRGLIFLAGRLAAKRDIKSLSDGNRLIGYTVCIQSCQASADRQIIREIRIIILGDFAHDKLGILRDA